MTTKAKTPAKASSTSTSKSAQDRAAGLADAFPGAQPDPGPEPRPAPALSKEQRAFAEQVRESQLKTHDDQVTNVPEQRIIEVLAHIPAKKDDDTPEIKALTLSHVGNEVVLHVDATDLHFNREEFLQLLRGVSSIGASL